MKHQAQSIISKLCIYFLLLVSIFSSCKKEKEIASTTAFKTTVDGKSYTLDENKLSVNKYSDTGDPKTALQVAAVLDNNNTQLVFFINDLSDAIITINPKSGTSLNPKAPQIPTITDIVDQSYVRYIFGGSSFYAYSGSITLKTTDNVLSYTWTINFKDASAREFTSTGSMLLNLSKYTSKPKTEITDPTPLSTKPTIESIAPNIGSDGTEVTVSGTNFSPTITDNVVKFNGTDAVVKSATATSLVVTAPTGGTTGAISVKVKNSETTTGPIFTYQALPTILSVNPGAGKVGDAVTILGTNFSSVLSENVVKFNGTVATLTSVTGGGIQLTVPAGATTGPVSISVKGSATVTGPQFQVNTTNTGGSGSVDYITKLDGTAGFTKIATASNKITEMFIDKNSKTLYYSDFDQLVPNASNTVYKLSLTGGDPVKFSADARVKNISYITTDIQGNVYMLYNQDNATQKVSILKSTADGLTVTELAKDISLLGNTTRRLYVDSEGTVWLGHSNKIVNGVDIYVSSHNANSAYDGPLFKGDQAYLVDRTQNANLLYKTLNLVTGVNAPTDFDVQKLFGQDDAKLSTNSLTYVSLAIDGDENAFILYPLSYQTGQLTTTWIIRKTKNGAAGASTLVAKFITKYSSNPYYAEPQGQANQPPVFVAGASGDIYMRYNDKDIIKISQ